MIPGGIHRIRIALLSASGWKDLRIVNISTSGVAVENALQRDFCVGQNVRARLALENKTFEMALEVRRRDSDILGLRVLNPEPSYQTALVAFFRKEIEAVRMVQVPADLQKRPDDGVPVWFRGSEHSELYLTASGKEVLTFQLAFFGHYFECDASGDLRYGSLLVSDRGPARVKESDLVNWEPEVDAQILESISAFVENINGLAVDLKQALIRRLKAFPVAEVHPNLQAGAAG